MANSLDPDQMPHSAASGLGQHCLLRPVCPILRVITLYRLNMIIALNKALINQNVIIFLLFLHKNMLQPGERFPLTFAYRRFKSACVSAQSDQSLFSA